MKHSLKTQKQTCYSQIGLAKRVKIGKGKLLSPNIHHKRISRLLFFLGLFFFCSFASFWCFFLGLFIYLFLTKPKMQPKTKKCQIRTKTKKETWKTN